MEQTVDLNRVALEALRVRITKVMPEQIRASLEQLTDEQIWWRPNNYSNSIGNLVLHVRGSVMHFLVRGVGGVAYERDRPAEFAADGSLTRQQLLELFDEMVAETVRTFDSLAATRMTDPSTEPAYYSTVLEDLLGVAFHMATHMGQIVYVTKMLNEDSVKDLWSRTHKAAGAWRT
jgi:uncharacterized damage-inducible protein DinB